MGAHAKSVFDCGNALLLARPAQECCVLLLLKNLSPATSWLILFFLVRAMGAGLVLLQGSMLLVCGDVFQTE